jgi:nucleotide-binding universal stress UspA family protein
MLKSLLVGLDGSPYSETAVEMGLRWAQRFDALLVGLGIIEEPAAAVPEPVPFGPGEYKAYRDAVLADARRKAERFLEQFALRCAGAKVACKLLEDVGMPWEQIVREAERYDLVLLGKRTYFHFEQETEVDDTLTRVVKHSPRPVVTAPEVLSGKGVLVAYDGSLAAARALQSFQALGLDESEEVHVVSVAPSYGEAARCADRAAEFLRLHEVNARAVPVASDAHPAEVIMDQVRQLSPRLLVMGAYGRPAWREFLFGSVTQALLKRSPVPVFLSL